MAQRLVRRNCKKCAEPYMPNDHEITALKLSASDLKEAKILKGKGCKDCSNTGYRGRMGIYEIFILNDDVRQLIYDRVPANVLRVRAREMGMRTLREDGIRKIMSGITTPEAVISITQGDEE